MADVLVWVLIAFTGASYAPPVMFGPFSDLESCQRVQDTAPIKKIGLSQCVQVKQPRSK